MKSIEQVINENPELYAHGWAYRDGPIGVLIDRGQFEHARRFIQQRCVRIAGSNRKSGSHGFKHDAEDWAGTYISNGAFIAAALAEGYTLRRFPGSPNCSFNLKVRS